MHYLHYTIARQRIADLQRITTRARPLSEVGAVQPHPSQPQTERLRETGAIRVGSASGQRSAAVDRALAGGADPSASPLLAARAAQLVDPSTRKRIAGCLEQFAFTADRPPSRVKTLPLRGAVRPNQDALLHIARTLRDGQLQYARGIAMLELVLADGAGPAYTDPTGDGLAHQLALAVQALTGMAGACLVGAVG